MPWTIYRYILKQLLRLLASALVVLVVVISLAASIKPLSEGLLEPLSMVKYVLFLTPTMLGFTAPFAAAFAGTMVYSRMEADNEVVACRAGGVGYAKLLAPAMGLGLAMSVTLFYLSNWVVPSFYRRAATMLEADFTRMLVTQIEQGRTVNLGRMILYADAVDDTQPPPVIPDSVNQPSKLIRLRGVAAGRTDGLGRLRNDAVAREADLLFYHITGQTWVTLRLRDLTYHDAAKGDLISVEEWIVPQVRLPTPFRNSPRFMSWSELSDMRRSPDLFDQVMHRKRQLVDAIATEKIAASIESHFSPGTGNPKPLVLLGPHDGDSYTLRAQSCVRDGTTLSMTGAAGEPVRFEYTRPGLATRVIDAAEARAWIEPRQLNQEPRIAIELRDAVVRDDAGRIAAAEHETLTLPRARLNTSVAGPMHGMTARRLTDLADRELPNVTEVAEAADEVRLAETKIVRKIVAQLHGRTALAAACTMVLLLSVILSMTMSGAMPLVIYFWSFAPAVVVVIATRSGENLSGDLQIAQGVGTAAIWSANALLGACVAVLFRRLNNS